MNALIVESLAAEVERVLRDEDLTARAKRLLERDKELLDRLARALRKSVGVPGFTIYEDEGAIILVFRSAGRFEVDLLVRPRVNAVRTRDC